MVKPRAFLSSNSLLSLTAKNIFKKKGTFGVEACVSSAVGRDSSRGLLVIENGAYGARIGTMARVHQMHHKVLSFPNNKVPNLCDISDALAAV